jgi:hypothetical protein
LEFLERKYAESGRSQFIVIYGQRRVGKTELIKQFVQGKSHVYFLADKLPEQNNLSELSEHVGRHFQDQFLMERGFANWQQVFSYLAPRAKGLIFVIDEFPYLIAANPATPSVFQKGWDEALKRSGIFLVLLGSSVSMMEDYVLGQSSPLFGRRIGQLRIAPLQFQDLRQYFNGKEFEEAASIWAVLGGIPYHWERFDPKLPLWDNINRHVFAKGEVLYQEAEFLLAEELREPRIYFSILRALALGKRKMAEILNETGLEKHVLSKYLAVLRELDLVERETPVTDQNPEKSKSGIYRIADPYMNFWFRFVFLNRSLLERGDTRTVLHEAKRDWNNYMGPVYEAIARQLFESWAATDQFSFRVTRIGRWWDKHQEIDLAAIDEQHQTLFCAEVKWTAKPVGTNIYDQLKVKAETLARQRAVRSAQLGLFSKCGFTEPLRKVAEKESVLLVKGDQVG